MRTSSAIVACTMLAVASFARAQSMAPYYDTLYTIEDLGSVPGVPLSYGEICFAQDDPNTLLIAGNATQLSAEIYTISVARDIDGHITGFTGLAAPFAAANGPSTGGIDCSLRYADNGVLLFTTYDDNTLAQIGPGSDAPDKYVLLGPLGVTDSVGGYAVVPPGFSGAGRLKIMSYYPGEWYDASLVPDGTGTFDVADVSAITPIPAGPSTMEYVAKGQPGFTENDVLIAKFNANRVDIYSIDANGDPIIFTEYPFINGITAAEGMAFDPISGDLLVSTYSSEIAPGGDQVYVVRGFNPPNNCSADLNHDGDVNGADLGTLLGGWGTAAGDVTGDGLTDASDLGVLLGAWGACP